MKKKQSRYLTGKKYCQQRLTWKFFLFRFLPASTFVLFVFIITLLKKSQIALQYGPVVAEARAKPWLWLASALLVSIIVWLLHKIKHAHRCLTIYKHGIIIRLPFRKEKTLAWEHIAGISTAITDKTFLGIKISSHYDLVIFPATGKPIRLPVNSQNFPEIVSKIKAKRYPEILSRDRALLKTGAALDYGPISITKYHFTAQQKTIPWKKVRLVDIRNGQLVIELFHIRPVKIPIDKIMNPEVMMQIIQDEVIA